MLVEDVIERLSRHNPKSQVAVLIRGIEIADTAVTGVKSEESADIVWLTIPETSSLHEEEL